MTTGPNIVSGRTIVMLMHTSGSQPCKKIAQHASPEFLESVNAGDTSVPCLNCGRMVGRDELSNGYSYIEDEAVPNGTPG